MKTISKLGVVMLAVVAFLLLSGAAHATPSATLTGTETSLGAGLWQYAYTITNTSDPVADAGVDLYDLTFYYDSSKSLTAVAVPTGWDFIQGDGFLNVFSTIPGESPAGTDIGPGSMLSGFVFTADYQAGSVLFDATLLNPADVENPLLINGQSAVVPIPGVALLLGSGLVGLGWTRKKYCRP